MSDERTLARLSCTQVLALLSEYLDGELADDTRASFELHLAGCSDCTRFGGDLSATLAALRTYVLASPAPPDAVQEKLRYALAREPGPGRPRRS